MPDLLIHSTSTPSNIQPELDDRRPLTLSLPQSNEDDTNCGDASALPTYTDDTRDEVTCPTGSGVGDPDSAYSVTLDPMTLCLERPATLKRRDSIALRKSKLRHRIVGGASSRLQRQYSLRIVRNSEDFVCQRQMIRSSMRIGAKK
jgi:hypothetical protein